MADRVSQYAPMRSPRPVSRREGEESALTRLADVLRLKADRRRYQLNDMEQLAALEHRVDIDPYLRENPLRRLGYRESGGLRNVDYLPLAPKEASHYPEGFTENYLPYDEVGGYPIFRSLEITNPERAKEFRSYESEYLIPRGGVVAGSRYYSDPVLAHEFGHVGHSIVEDLVRKNPELAKRFEPKESPADIGYKFEEALVELGDNPEASWNLPETGEPITLEHTIQKPFGRTEMGRRKLERYNEIIQEIAAEELARRGEPPRANRMDTEEQGGIMGLLKSIFGGN